MLGRLIFLSSRWDTLLPSSDLRVKMLPATIEEVKRRIKAYLNADLARAYIWSEGICNHLNKDLGTSLVTCHDAPPPAPFDEHDLIVVAEPIYGLIDIEQLEYKMGMGGMERTWDFTDSTAPQRQPPREPKKVCYYPPFGDWKNIN